LHMAQELSGPQQALPVFKVLYRNTNRIQEKGGRKEEVLHPVAPGKLSAGQVNEGEALRTLVRQKEVAKAEQALAALARRSPDEAFNDLLYAVQDNTEVHRVVLPYRSYDLLDL